MLLHYFWGILKNLVIFSSPEQVIFSCKVFLLSSVLSALPLLSHIMQSSSAIQCTPEMLLTNLNSTSRAVVRSWEIEIWSIKNDFLKYQNMIVFVFQFERRWMLFKGFLRLIISAKQNCWFCRDNYYYWCFWRQNRCHTEAMS